MNTYQNIMNLIFAPLTGNNIEEAVRLCGSVFPDSADNIRATYERLLDPKKKYLENRRLYQYFAIIDSDTGKIAALTGLYNRKEYPEDEAWLGWFCVDPDMRGKGIGRKTLEWTMDRAREMGYKKFKLWTSTDPNESAAQNLYESVGLKIYKTEPNEDNPDEQILYREMDLLV